MKLRLRYVFVFLLGMACMYWMVRTGALTIDPMYRGASVPLVVESIVDTGVVVTGDVMSGSIISGAVIESGVIQTGDVMSGDEQILDDTVTMMQGSGDAITNDGSSSDTKDVACTKPDGIYDTPLIVGWSDVLTATTTSYIKLRNFLHYIVTVSNGEKYYFYHNCSNGVATSVRRIYGNEQLILSNGQIYFR